MPAAGFRKPIRPVIDNGDGTCSVTLTQGQFALIDTADRHLVESYNWRAGWSPRMQSYYAATSIKQEDTGKYKTVYLHRYILGVTDPNIDVDHIHHNTLDNRRSELRSGTTQQNCSNRRVNQGKTKSMYKGVQWNPMCGGVWEAIIGTPQGPKKLGRFANQEDAARAYDKAAVARFGAWACVNFPVTAPHTLASRSVR